MVVFKTRLARDLVSSSRLLLISARLRLMRCSASLRK